MRIITSFAVHLHLIHDILIFFRRKLGGIQYYVYPRLILQWLEPMALLKIRRVDFERFSGMTQEIGSSLSSSFFAQYN